MDLVDNAGGGGDEVEVVFPLQALLNDLHVQQTQEAAPEAKAQGDGGLRFIGEGGIVELQLFQGIPEVGILGAVHRIDTRKDHGVDLPVAGQRLGSRS